MNENSLRREVRGLSVIMAIVAGTGIALALSCIWKYLWVMDCLALSAYVHRGALVFLAVGLIIALVRRSLYSAVYSLVFVASFWACDSAFYRLEWRDCFERKGSLGYGVSGKKTLGNWTSELEQSLFCGDPRSAVTFNCANDGCLTQVVTMAWEKGDSITNVLNVFAAKNGYKVEIETSGNWQGKGIVPGDRYDVAISLRLKAEN